MTKIESAPASDFIRNIIAEDIMNNKNDGRVATRFPPEPNGYLHIGHAKSICLNFGIAKEYKGGTCNLRFDDTNPSKEEVEYVESIKDDVRWLGFDWENRLFYASDYFEQLYEYAVQLIKLGKAYVCSLNNEEIRKTRGTLTEPGIESPFRSRSVVDATGLLQAQSHMTGVDGGRQGKHLLTGQRFQHLVHDLAIAHPIRGHEQRERHRSDRHFVRSGEKRNPCNA